MLVDSVLSFTSRGSQKGLATMKKIIRSAFLSLFFCLTGVLYAVQALAEDGWQFTLPVYAWLPTYEFELPSGQKGKITQDDILSNLDMALMAAPRVERGRWSFVTDVIYMDLSNKDRKQFLPFLDLRQVELQEWLVTPTVGYRIYQSGRSSLELYGGARYIWLEPTLKFQRQAPLEPGAFHESESADRWDGILGIRGEVALEPLCRFLRPFRAEILELRHCCPP